MVRFFVDNEKTLDSPDEQAEEFKKDGTFHFKHKLYKKAIIAYSKAIAVKPTDQKLLVSTGVPDTP